MNVRRINLSLWTLCGAFMLFAAALIIFALSPVDVQVDVTPDRNRVAATTRATANLPELASFEPIWKLPLRVGATENLAVTPQNTDANPPATNSTGQLTLVGTIGSSLAMLRTPAGIVEVKAVGESAAGAKVLAIRPSQVDIEQAGQKITLTRPKDSGGG
jgi:hypothetical protein